MRGPHHSYCWLQERANGRMGGDERRRQTRHEWRRGWLRAQGAVCERVASEFVRAMWRREANDTVTVRRAQASKRTNQGLLSDTTTRHSRERKEFSRAFSGAASTATTAARHTHGTTAGRDPQHETNTRERSTQTEMLLRLTFLLSAVSDSPLPLLPSTNQLLPNSDNDSHNDNSTTNSARHVSSSRQAENKGAQQQQQPLRLCLCLSAVRGTGGAIFGP